MPGWFDGWPGSGTLLKPARKHLPFWLGSKSEITMVSNRVVETVRYERGIFGKPLVPLTQAWAQVVVGRVETGGGDGGTAGLVAGVRGAVPRRRGLRPLAVREALARRVPLPGLRARQGHLVRNGGQQRSGRDRTTLTPVAGRGRAATGRDRPRGS